MISNIFGLHIGCRVKINNTGDEGKIINVSTSLANIGEGILTIEDFHNGMRTRYIKDCKLLLKPLSAMSDEDKREFDKLFMNKRKIENVYAENGLVCVLLKPEDGRSSVEEIYDKHFPTIGTCTVKELIWLCSKGYDVGLVPDEYKGVVK